MMWKKIFIFCIFLLMCSYTALGFEANSSEYGVQGTTTALQGGSPNSTLYNNITMTVTPYQPTDDSASTFGFLAKVGWLFSGISLVEVPEEPAVITGTSSPNRVDACKFEVSAETFELNRNNITFSILTRESRGVNVSLQNVALWNYDLIEIDNAEGTIEKNYPWFLYDYSPELNVTVAGCESEIYILPVDKPDHIFSIWISILAGMLLVGILATFTVFGVARYQAWCAVPRAGQCATFEEQVEEDIFVERECGLDLVNDDCNEDAENNFIRDEDDDWRDY